MSIETPSLQLKASFYTITVLQFKECDPSMAKAALQQWAANTPQLLKGLPVIIDIPGKDQTFESLGVIVNCVRDYGLVPIGIQGIKKEQAHIVNDLHLALFSRQRRDMSQSKPTTKSENIVKVPTLTAPTILESVRSGQQIHVKGDLIILHSVSLGAEVSAEGNIHIYGTLKGRAFAGAKGNKKAAIFCHTLEAELVAIAGCYWQYDDLQKNIDTTNLQIYLENEALNIRQLG